MNKTSSYIEAKILNSIKGDAGISANRILNKISNIRTNLKVIRETEFRINSLFSLYYEAFRKINS